MRPAATRKSAPAGDAGRVGHDARRQVAEQDPDAGQQVVQAVVGADQPVARVRELGDVQILTPGERDAYGAITAFRLSGRAGEADNVAIAEQLMSRHRVFTVARTGMTGGGAVRVTPALFTSADDVDRLTEALRAISRRPPPRRPRDEEPAAGVSVISS
ncbi:hypothetical protein AB0M50_31050 [Nonomuraea fuscirosea]|uniref:hypothetical protein n=1 Tax=Nonomuraea fuscirosea TaxID=1291556 RepID=UPI0034309E68